MSFKKIVFKGSLTKLPQTLMQAYIKIAQERYRDKFNLPPPRIEHYQAFLLLPEPESAEQITVITVTTESVIGYVSSFRNTKYDNIDMAEITIFTTNQYQYKGFESLLLSELLPLLSEEVTLLTFPFEKALTSNNSPNPGIIPLPTLVDGALRFRTRQNLIQQKKTPNNNCKKLNHGASV